MSSESEKREHSDGWLTQEREMVERFFETLVPEKLGSTKAVVTCTAKACDEYAQRILQAKDIQVVENQGATSYTLICPSQGKIVQFRLRRFDEEVLALAHKIYADLVPSVTFYDDFPLPVYVSPVIPGQIHIFQDFSSPAFPLERQLTTVKELAQFVAKSAYWPQPKSSYSATSWTETARTTLEKLIQNDDLKRIEPRFIEKARSLLTKIPLLNKLPPVLSHADFAEINILVSSEGNVTGVIDFEDAQTEAFGMCIFGIFEGFFGVMEDQKWRFFDQLADDGSGNSVRTVLETAFWNALWDALPPEMSKQKFEDAVMVALDIGIVNRYFVRGLLERVDLESEDHRISLEFARGILLDR
ncbi:hypothetical protein MMC22_009301 [Lobaria immixta]|nr:hypothetical protein [Lobaria immixta]